MRALIFIGSVLALLGVGIFWFIGDGSTPRDAAYEFPLAEMRSLIDAGTGSLPATLNVEITSTEVMPKLVAHAGFATKPFKFAMTSFQLRGATGDFIIGSAMDESLYELTHQSNKAEFHQAAYDRMIAAIIASKATLITHEHIDHLGGIVRAPDREAIAPHLMLSQEQIDGIAILSRDGSVPRAYRNLAPADLSTPTLLAPGLAVAPTLGHSPGSQSFLIRTADGQEYFLVGDIVWAMANVEKAWGRPRILQQLFFKGGENRGLVQRQVRALHDLGVREPGLIILPSHDHQHLDRLIAAEKLTRGFQQ